MFEHFVNQRAQVLNGFFTFYPFLHLSVASLPLVQVLGRLLSRVQVAVQALTVCGVCSCDCDARFWPLRNRRYILGNKTDVVIFLIILVIR